MELSLEKIDRKLAMSLRMRQVWGWVGQKAMGETFYAIEITKDVPALSQAPMRHFGHLENFTLIERQVNPAVSFPMPFEKVNEALWLPVHELLVRHNVVPATEL